MSPDYDKQDIYDKELAPLMTQVLRICNENRIPFFAAFGTKMTDGEFRVGDGLTVEQLLPKTVELSHKDKCFAGFVKIVLGAEALFPEEKPRVFSEDDMEFDEEIEKNFGKQVSIISRREESYETNSNPYLQDSGF